MRYISLNYNSKGITDKTLKSVSKIENLSNVCKSAQNITNSAINYFIKKSPQMKHISINFRKTFSIDVNEDKNHIKSTINAFIERVVKYPNIQYTFQLKSDIKILFNNHLIPKNLKIKQIFI